MKKLYVTFLLLASIAISACDSPKKDSNTSENTNDQTEKAKDLGQKVPAPIVDIGEFSRMSKADLRLARNTVYAKYGRVFASKDLKDHFSMQDWYNEKPTFKESDINEHDLELIKLIRMWEEQTDVLLKEKADITGNGSNEFCFVLYNKNKGKYAIIVNDFVQEFDHFWGQTEDEEGAPTDWSEITAKIIDIDSEDFKQEILVSQRYDDWEDPGTHNVIVAFYKSVEITELGSTNYDSGILDFEEDTEVAMQFSNCPNHIKKYHLDKGKLVEFDETIGPTPPGGCAACFSNEAMVSTSETTTKPISELKRGDIVLTFDEKKQTYSETAVKRMLTVHHDNMIALSFGDSKVTVTDDHPFLTEQGWASFDPENTMKRYGYQNVLPLSVGVKLVAFNGENQQLKSIEKVESGMTTYTISTLENGANYVVNGVIVGTETLTTPVN